MKNLRVRLLIITLVALMLRLGFILFYDNGKMLSEKYYSADESTYDGIASNILKGKGFVMGDSFYARVGPAYPFFLAIIYSIFGHSLLVARIVQACLGAVTCVLVYYIGKEAFDEEIGLIASLISAVYYPFIQQPSYVLTEVLFTFLLLSSALFLIKYSISRRILALFLGSFLLALSVLCRSIILPFFPIFLALVLFVERSSIKVTLTRAVVILLGFFIVLSPWIMRNYFLYKSFVPVSIEGGRILYLGNNPRSTGGTGGRYSLGVDAFLPDDIKDPFSLESDRKMFRRAVRYIFEHPKRVLILSFRKTVNMWLPYYSDARLINKVIMVISYFPLMLFAVIGAIFAIREYPKKVFIVYVFIVYLIFIHSLGVTDIRYRYPIMPFLVVFSAFSIRKSFALFRSVLMKSFRSLFVK